MEDNKILEMAKIFGEPKDPRKPYPNIVDKVCETDVAEVDEFHYYFDVINGNDSVYILNTIGAVTQINATPDVPVALSFTDVASPEYYVKLVDLASAKERTVSRYLKSINRALNAYESKRVVDLMAAGNAGTETLGAGYSTFNYEHLVNMIDSVIDYGDSYTLVAGTTIDKDIKLWDWNDNKYTSLSAAFKDLNTEVVRVNSTVSVDGSTTTALASTKAYLVAKDTEVGKPMLFVRKKLNDIDLLGGAIKKGDGDKPERLVFVSPNPVTVTSTARYLAVGVTGFEEIALATKNSNAIYEFNRVT